MLSHSKIPKIRRSLIFNLTKQHSAHFYIRENINADTGNVTLLIFLQILSEKKQTPAELISSYNFFPTSGEINFTVKDVKESITKVEQNFDNSFDKLDGISYFDQN